MQFFSFAALLISVQATNAFQTVPATRITSSCSPTQLQLSAGDYKNRRQAFSQAAATFFTVASIAVGSPMPVLAKGPEYLSDPTEDFKESERQRSEFRMAQIKVKKLFVDNLERITTTAKSEEDLKKALEDFKQLIADSGGLPLGIKKDDIVKQIRAKKGAGFWPTSAEYAYQGVIREIAYQQSPNKDKDVANPL